MKELGLRTSKGYLRPCLKDSGKMQRLERAVRWVLPTFAGGFKFQSFMNFVHLDEKWFYPCKHGQKYILLEGEDTPTRKVRHKSHIPKVVFLAVVARTRFDASASTMFSGKLGIFPSTVKRVAQAGTMETKCVEATRARYKAKLIGEVISAIKASGPAAGRGETIWAQQRNAPSHNINDDRDIFRECATGGWDMRFISQPPNSPDLNILDLNFFNAIQSLQDRSTPRTIDKLIASVNVAINAQTLEQLGMVWTNLKIILYIMLAQGDNTFKIPHLKATTQRRGGSVPIELPCSQEA